MQKQTKPNLLGLSMAKLVLAAAIIVSLGTVLGVAGYLAKTSTPTYEQCLKMESKISEDIDSLDSSCEADSDCKTLIFSGNWRNVCVNRDTDADEAQSAVKSFLKKCTFPGVWPPIECSCIKNKCTVIKEKREEADETADWKTYRNKEYGFEIKYPENFGANVWRSLFWPPRATVISINEDPLKIGCPDFPIGIEGATEYKIRINNIDYTFYWASEGAMGSSYANYCYVTQKDQNYYVLYLVIRSATGCGYNCGAYCGTQHEAECENLDRVKDIEKPIEKMLSTFQFLE